VRTPAVALAVLACAGIVIRPGPASGAPPQAKPAPPPPPPPNPAADDLARARALDQQGAKAYADGRYNDAIRYFEEAYRLGGPPFELWNIAKCHVRLDQPEQAAEVLERYLALQSLPPEDREEAEQQLDGLRKRPSTLTVASSPTGAGVSIDGKPVEGARTPLTVSVPPGQHTVAVALPKYVIETREVEARYGRAVILDVPLDEDPRAQPLGDSRLALTGFVGLSLPRHGEVGGAAGATGVLTGTYRALDLGRTSLAFGGLVSIAGDSWNNTIGAPTTNVAGCSAALRDPHGAAATSLMAIAAVGWPVGRRVRIHGVLGAGLAMYLAGSDVGGDLFAPSCDAKTGLRPALVFGAKIDYALTPRVHLSALPITVQLHEAFDGARAAPRDATGLWVRAAIAIGAGVDL
jgi:hypothetical protein